MAVTTTTTESVQQNILTSCNAQRQVDSMNNMKQPLHPPSKGRATSKLSSRNNRRKRRNSGENKKLASKKSRSKSRNERVPIPSFSCAPTIREDVCSDDKKEGGMGEPGEEETNCASSSDERQKNCLDVSVTNDSSIVATSSSSTASTIAIKDATDVVNQKSTPPTSENSATSAISSNLLEKQRDKVVVDEQIILGSNHTEFDYTDYDDDDDEGQRRSLEPPGLHNPQDETKSDNVNPSDPPKSMANESLLPNVMKMMNDKLPPPPTNTKINLKKGVDAGENDAKDDEDCHSELKVDSTRLNSTPINNNNSTDTSASKNKTIFSLEYAHAAKSEPSDVINLLDEDENDVGNATIIVQRAQNERADATATKKKDDAPSKKKTQPANKSNQTQKKKRNAASDSSEDEVKATKKAKQTANAKKEVKGESVAVAEKKKKQSKATTGKKKQCFACTSCKCNTRKGIDATPTKLSALSGSDARQEQTLVNRLQRIERNIAWNDGQRNDIARELKKHRGQMLKKYQSSNDSAQKPRFLADVEVTDELGGTKVDSKEVNRANSRMFGRQKSKP